MNSKNMLSGIIGEIRDVAGRLWEKGWAERNAGNISLNVTGLIDTDELIITGEVVLKERLDALRNASLLITSTGSRMRNIACEPEKYLCVLHFDEHGERYFIGSLTDDASISPSSELPTHLLLHHQFLLTNNTKRAVVHAHVTEAIALSHFHEFADDHDFTALVWKTHPESLFFMPEGIGFVPFCFPGSDDIARVTADKMLTYNIVLWEKHGVYASASSLTDAFDLMDIVAKSFRIFLMCRNAGVEPLGLNDEQVRALQQYYSQLNDSSQ